MVKQGEMAHMSMAQFEASGEDIASRLWTTYRAKFIRLNDGGIDVGVFSEERHPLMAGPKYGLLEKVNSSMALLYGGRELKNAPDEIKAAYIACGLLQHMLLAEAARMDDGTAEG